MKQRRPMSGLLDSKADLMFRNLLSTIVENAQLAALEIADGVDPADMPEMLETVRASVARYRGDAGATWSGMRPAMRRTGDPPTCPP